MTTKILGIALVVVALAIALVPQFTDCLSQGQMVALANGTKQPMKCHWSAQAEIAVGAPLVAVGAILPFSRRRGTTRSLAVLGIVLGAVAIALPYSLSGTCAMPTHFCNTAMKPALTALGSVAIVGSLGVMLSASRMKG